MTTNQTPPLFSICIPQHNRTSFLLKVLESFARQSFLDFEVCISDDCSTDGREDEIVSFLDSNNIRYKLKKQSFNLRYDGNIREAIALASGSYILLMGNDDCLASPTVLQELADLLAAHPSAGVVVTNFENYTTGAVNVRVKRPQCIPGNVTVAALNFRNLAFVSGIALERRRAQECATPRWDGSEMYQVFLSGRILSAGLELLHFPRVSVRKDVQIPGELVGNYARQPVVRPCPIVERRTNLTRLGQVACGSLITDSQTKLPERLLFLVFAQIIVFTYPFWLVEYRRLQSWKFSAGLSIGMRLRAQLGELKPSFPTYLALTILYVLATGLGLFTPLWIFDRLRPFLYGIAKSNLPWLGRSTPAPASC